jgi:DNA polymerase III epsilon subunit-like protein
MLELTTVAKFYGLDVDNAHHALYDAFLTAQVWQKMMTPSKPRESAN